MNKVYLGDSVYASFDGYSLELTTENGGPPSNTIILEPEVYRALMQYVVRLQAEPQGPTVADSVAAMDQYVKHQRANAG